MFEESWSRLREDDKPTEESRKLGLYFLYRPLVVVCCNRPLIVTDYSTYYKLATTLLMLAAICFVFGVLSGPGGLTVLPQTPDFHGVPSWSRRRVLRPPSNICPSR